jgi:hypothetical protein
VSATDRPVLAPDLADAVAQAGIDPTLDGRALKDALRRAIATRRGSCPWTVDHAGWLVTLDSPEEQEFYGCSVVTGVSFPTIGPGGVIVMIEYTLPLPSESPDPS